MDLFIFSCFSSNLNTKEEKRPWVLRAKELSIQAGNKLTPEESNTLPQRLIYISCGWESFKEVLETNTDITSILMANKSPNNAAALVHSNF